MPQLQSHVPAPRREFLRDAIRYSVLAGLGALAASTVARRGPLTGSGCPGSGECSRCAQALGCTLPQKKGVNPGEASPQTTGPLRQAQGRHGAFQKT